MLDLEPIKKELAATTQGEWRVVQPGLPKSNAGYPPDYSYIGPNDCGGIVTDKAIVCHYGDAEQYYPASGVAMDSADHAFVINAHNRHVPALIAEVERLRADLEARPANT